MFDSSSSLASYSSTVVPKTSTKFPSLTRAIFTEMNFPDFTDAHTSTFQFFLSFSLSDKNAVKEPFLLELSRFCTHVFDNVFSLSITLGSFAHVFSTCSIASSILFSKIKRAAVTRLLSISTASWSPYLT